MGSGQWLAVLEHAHQRQDLLTQPLVLVYYSAEVFSKVAELRLGRVYALVTRLDDADDFGKVILGGRGFLCSRVCGCGGGLASRLQRGACGWGLCGRCCKLTKRHIVLRVERYILPYLDLIDGLENGEAMAHTAYTQLLQLGVLQCGEHVACDALIYKDVISTRGG